MDEAKIGEQPRYRLSDQQALGLLIAYFVFHFIANRVGLGYLPQLLDSAPWVVPLLNNSMLGLIATGTAASSQSSLMMVATGATSVIQSFIAGLVLYWAGFRFGPMLAERAAQPGSMWASIWNPKQIERATRWIDRRGVYAILIARGFIEFMMAPVMLVAGSARMRLEKFLASFFVASVIFAGLFLWLGARAGDQWPWLPDKIKAFGTWSFRITIGLLVVAGLLMLIVKRFEPTKPSEADQEPDSTITPSQPSSVTPPETD